MDQLPATNPPADPNSDPKTWPQRNYDVGFDLAGGWEGDFAGEFGVQEWGGRTDDGARGYLALASWITPHGLVPVAPVFHRRSRRGSDLGSPAHGVIRSARRRHRFDPQLRRPGRRIRGGRPLRLILGKASAPRPGNKMAGRQPCLGAGR
jgi:hypothetical protein